MPTKRCPICNSLRLKQNVFATREWRCQKCNYVYIEPSRQVNLRGKRIEE